MLNKPALLPILKEEWLPVGDETHRSTLPSLLVFSQIFVIVQATSFVLGWLPVAEGVPRPVRVPEGRISVSTWTQADWKLDPQAVPFKV